MSLTLVAASARCFADVRRDSKLCSVSPFEVAEPWLMGQGARVCHSRTGVEAGIWAATFRASDTQPFQPHQETESMLPVGGSSSISPTIPNAAGACLKVKHSVSIVNRKARKTESRSLWSFICIYERSSSFRYLRQRSNRAASSSQSCRFCLKISWFQVCLGGSDSRIRVASSSGVWPWEELIMAGYIGGLGVVPALLYRIISANSELTACPLRQT